MKPKSVEVYPVYICGDCSARHCETLDYVQKIGKILCGCGSVLELTPIETFKISPVFSCLAKKKTAHSPSRIAEEVVANRREEKEKEYREAIATPEKPPSGKNKNRKGQESDETILKSVELLVSLGWRRGEAKQKVRELIDKWKKENNDNITEENFEEFANYMVFN